ncbi:MAG TPA: type II toxin-antitoxin system Phd/YefM family antitoxin [Candidatus Woesebacteria bacterium]|nr:type II toxin-antitoxin system Phd/YefM family antitoxin [Candidatus Woesebacteria bacterium]
MLQIINITEARNNLAKLIKKVKETKEPVIIVQDSSPSVVIYPYDEAFAAEQKKQKQFQEQFELLLKEGNKLGKQYLSDNKLSEKLSEEDAYDLIKNG